jgi:hypothetical protein
VFHTTERPNVSAPMPTTDGPTGGDEWRVAHWAYAGIEEKPRFATAKDSMVDRERVSAAHDTRTMTCCRGAWRYGDDGAGCALDERGTGSVRRSCWLRGSAAVASMSLKHRGCNGIYKKRQDAAKMQKLMLSPITSVLSRLR